MLEQSVPVQKHDQTQCAVNFWKITSVVVFQVCLVRHYKTHPAVVRLPAHRRHKSSVMQNWFSSLLWIRSEDSAMHFALFYKSLDRKAHFSWWLGFRKKMNECKRLKHLSVKKEEVKSTCRYIRIILCGPNSLSSHGAQRSARELNGSCKNRWKNSRKRIHPHLAVTVVWVFLSRVYPRQLKSLKMFVFAGKISHLSFIWGLVGQNRFHIWRTTQSSGFMLRCFPKSPISSKPSLSLFHFIWTHLKHKSHVALLNIKPLYWHQWFIEELLTSAGGNTLTWVA